MNDVYEFLKTAGTYYLATVEDDQPHVRPFGTIDLFDGHLAIQTGLVKDVAKQMLKNPKIELCAFKDGKWIRVTGEVELDERLEAQKHMLEAYPELGRMYQPGDGNTAIFRFKSGRAAICSFTERPVLIEF
ncbi:MAG: pyridoxamine 5'-phosphate oxidase family protein [Erysipelotrichaceae bacterium]|nr:pyridoxamine 5'-phosphate oxidase family protein [Erysipelotrichaceae bacterium]